jgi:hypothetical protein
MKKSDGYKSRKFWFSVGAAIAVVWGYKFAVEQVVKGGGWSSVSELFHAFTFAMFILSGVYGAQNIGEIVFGKLKAKAKEKGPEGPPKS